MNCNRIRVLRVCVGALLWAPNYALNHAPTDASLLALASTVIVCANGITAGGAQ